ncbi:hypothetical protein B0H34DRAFT_686445 [Crassisporium funariophilum]|nr:hypothetical protein B0H34DRAFT_686445 [Crassisporium funariophilum]
MRKAIHEYISGRIRQHVSALERKNAVPPMQVKFSGEAQTGGMKLSQVYFVHGSNTARLKIGRCLIPSLREYGGN